MGLDEKKCLPCEGGAARLTREEAAELHKEIPRWILGDVKIQKRFQFEDFISAMKFINAMADLAEEEGHHPDFCVHYSKVDITIWTHAIGGLSENDFILAAKIDRIEN